MVGHRMSWWVMALVLIVSACGDTSDSASDPTRSATTQSDASSEGGNVSDIDSQDDPPVPTGAPAATTSTSASVTTPPETDPGADGPGPGELAPGEPGEQDPDDSATNPSTSSTVVPDIAVPPGLESLVATARADLAALLSIAETEIAISVAEFMVWPDAGLGCPEPGMVYTQVQVDGWRVVLTHANTSYTYHGGGSRPGPFLCRNPSFPVG